MLVVLGQSASLFGASRPRTDLGAGFDLGNDYDYDFNDESPSSTMATTTLATTSTTTTTTTTASTTTTAATTISTTPHTSHQESGFFPESWFYKRLESHIVVEEGHVEYTDGHEFTTQGKYGVYFAY